MKTDFHRTVSDFATMVVSGLYRVLSMIYRGRKMALILFYRRNWQGRSWTEKKAGQLRISLQLLAFCINKYITKYAYDSLESSYGISFTHDINTSQSKSVGRRWINRAFHTTLVNYHIWQYLGKILLQLLWAGFILLNSKFYFLIFFHISKKILKLEYYFLA